MRDRFLNSISAVAIAVVSFGIVRGVRTQEEEFAKGQGPDPAAKDVATDFVGVEDDPLQ